MAKEIPILFGTMMVQAILDGRKTQTRRIIKDHTAQNWSEAEMEGMHHAYKEWYNEDTGKMEPAEWLLLNGDEDVEDILGQCRHGKAGDILYVKEEHYAWGWWVKNGFTKGGKQKWRFVDFTFDDAGYSYHYFDNPPSDVINGRPERKMGWYKRNSLFMPKEAARIWLQVEDVRVERLMDISVEDIVSEGIVSYQREHDACCDLKDQWQKLWIRINGQESLNANPWVFVITFKVLSTTGRPENINTQ